MNNFDLEKTLSTMTCIIDSREHPTAEAKKRWESFGVPYRIQANGYSEKMSIDRIDNQKGYSPDNCRWVTMTVQQNNRTNNRMITVNGITDTMANWSRKSGIPYSTMQERLKRGWSEEEAVTIPLKGIRAK